jgi:hypothetical protein
VGFSLGGFPVVFGGTAAGDGLGVFRFGGASWGALGVAGARGIFCPGGGFTVGLGVGFPPGGFPGAFDGTTAGDGLGAFRFGGAPLGAPGVAPGTFPLGDWLGPGEAGTVGFPPGPTGERPGVAKGFAPRRLGGMGFLPGACGLGVAPGATFALGGLAPGFSKLAGGFCPTTGAGDPGRTGAAAAPGVAAPCLSPPIRGRTKGAGFGRLFGVGF